MQVRHKVWYSALPLRHLSIQCEYPIKFNYWVKLNQLGIAWGLGFLYSSLLCADYLAPSSQRDCPRSEVCIVASELQIYITRPSHLKLFNRILQNWVHNQSSHNLSSAQQKRTSICCDVLHASATEIAIRYGFPKSKVQSCLTGQLMKSRENSIIMNQSLVWHLAADGWLFIPWGSRPSPWIWRFVLVVSWVVGFHRVLICELGV